MSVRYTSSLDRVRRQFLEPGDPQSENCFLTAVVQAAERLLLTGRNESRWADAPREAERAGFQIEREGIELSRVAEELAACIAGLPIWIRSGHQANIDPPPAVAGVVSTLLSAMANANLCSNESGAGVLQVEREVVRAVAELVGYDPACAEGVFTFGGAGGLLYGVRAGLEAACPGHAREGLRGQPVILTSEAAHHSVLSVASWLGIGETGVIRVPIDDQFRMDLDALRRAARKALGAERPIAAIVATLGTTDAFGLDDLSTIDTVRNEIAAEFGLADPPHLHADAVAAWAWSMFREYDFRVNPLTFGPETLTATEEVFRATRALRLADSIGVDFHKTGYAPYASSLVLFRERERLFALSHDRGAMPYLSDAGERQPGWHTLETSRGGSGPLAAFACLRALGAEGMQTLLGHAVSMALLLKNHLREIPSAMVLNSENSGPSTLFRVYPSRVDAELAFARERNDADYRGCLREHNQFNAAVLERMQAAEQGGVTLSLTRRACSSCAGEPIWALKSYVMSPFTGENTMRSVVENVVRARTEVEREQSGSRAVPVSLR